MGFIGFLISAVAVFFALIAWLDVFLLWLNWFILPFAVLGLTLSAISLSRGGMRPLGVLGVTLAAAAIILACIKLIIGWGVI
jgi:hypothetical protein